MPAVVLDLFFIPPLIRINMLVHERLQPPLQVLGFFVKLKIHIARLCPILPLLSAASRKIRLTLRVSSPVSTGKQGSAHLVRPANLNNRGRFPGLASRPRLYTILAALGAFICYRLFK